MKAPYRLIFFASLAVLAYEVSLVRLFSIRFSYHYASLVVSISMLGLVAGALTHSIRRAPGAKVTGPESPSGPMPAQSARTLVFGLSISFPAILAISSLLPFDPYRLPWEGTEVLHLPFLVLLQAVPFFFYGRLLSAVFSMPEGNPFRIYAADLAGAAAGVLVLLLLLEVVQPDRVPPLLSILLAVVGAFEGQKRGRRILYSLLPVVLSVFVLTLPATGRMSPYKGLMQALSEDGAFLVETIHRYDGRMDAFENQRMKSAPGLSLAWDRPGAEGHRDRPGRRYRRGDHG